MPIENPYWTIYSKLASLRAADICRDTKNAIRDLARQAHLSITDTVTIQLLMLLPWFKSRMIEEIFFVRLREQFAYSVLSPEMLNIIAGYSPLVELGAGNGYNAWLLQQMSAEITALDAYPVEEGKNWFFDTRFGLPTRLGHSWTKVQKGDSKALEAYPDHTLFLCWPPKNSMAQLSLTHFVGNKLIFVGNKPCCANAPFYKALAENWKLEFSTATGSWDSCHQEVLAVYSQ